MRGRDAGRPRGRLPGLGGSVAFARLAAVLRGERVPPIQPLQEAPPSPALFTPPGDESDALAPVTGGEGGATGVRTRALPVMILAPGVATLQQLGKLSPKVHAPKLLQGNPAGAAKAACEWARRFPGRFYLEVQRAARPDDDALVAAIRRGTMARRFVPILGGSAFRNRGVQPLLDAVSV